MFQLTLETAKVVSVDDEDKAGKVQINIEHKMKGVKKDLLPWAIPFFSKTSDSTWSNHPPKVGSEIWVFVDEYWKRFYYLSNRYFYNLFNYDKTKGLLDKCEKINKEYKNLDFTYFEDGSLIFHNNSDGSSGIINSQGTLLYLDKEGSLINEIEKDEKTTIKGNREERIKGKDTITVEGQTSFKYNNTYALDCDRTMDFKSQGNASFKSKGQGILDIGNTTNTLGAILKELCQDLAQLVTSGSPSTHTSPQLTSQMIALINKINMVFK